MIAMKTFIVIVFLLGTTICTTNLSHSPPDKKDAELSAKSPDPNPNLSKSDDTITSSNNDPPFVPNIDSTRVSNNGPTCSPAGRRQEDKTADKSELSERKNIVPLRKKHVKSPKEEPEMVKRKEEPEMVKPNGEEPEMVKPKGEEPEIVKPKGEEPEIVKPKGEEPEMVKPKGEEPGTVKESPSLREPTEDTHGIFVGPEGHNTKGSETPTTQDPINKVESTEVTQQRENKTVQGQDTKDKNVTEQEKTPSCSVMWPECPEEHLDDAASEVSKHLMAFTLKLFQTLSAQKPKSNLVVSPTSVALVLSHLMLGTNGETTDVMLNTLYRRVKDVGCIHQTIHNLTSQGAVLSASEIFYNKEVHINKEFMAQSLKYYGSSGIPLLGDEQTSLKKINSWVSQKTKQLIPTILEELPPDLQLMLVNVIQYQGKWLSQFDPQLTKKEKFISASSGPIKVPMMNAHKYPLQVYKDNYLQAQIARFPLSDNCSLLIFLPLGQGNDALKDLEKHLREDVVNLLITQLEEAPIRSTAVSFPQLKLDTKLDMNEALKSLGLFPLFEYPNLCALTNTTGLAVSDVQHRAVLEVKEEGVKAAVASTVGVARSITLFAVRRPFLFILVSDKSRVPILIGHVNDPSL